MSLPTPRRYRAEREFGLLVGAIFAALGGWWLYRQKFLPVAEGFVALGGVLLVAGALVPRFLVVPRRLWMAFAERLGQVVSTVILALVYFLVLTPIGLVKRAFGWDPLERRAAAGGSHWRPYSPRQRDPKHYEKMY